MGRSAAAIVLALGIATAFACRATLEGAEGPPDPSDAGTDATSSDADVAQEGGSYCARASGAAYCEDFDRETDITKLLFSETSNPNDQGFLPHLTGDTFRSPPRSLRMALPQGGAQGSFTVFRKPFAAEATVRVELDWQVNGALAEGTMQSITLRRAGPQVAFGRSCGGEPVTCSWYVARCVTGTSPCDALYTWPSAPFVGKWARVYLEARFTKNGHLAFGEVGAQPVLDADVPMFRDTDDANAPTILTVGLATLQGASPGVEMWFDSIVVTEK